MHWKQKVKRNEDTVLKLWTNFNIRVFLLKLLFILGHISKAKCVPFTNRNGQCEIRKKAKEMKRKCRCRFVVGRVSGVCFQHIAKWNWNKKAPSTRKLERGADCFQIANHIYRLQCTHGENHHTNQQKLHNKNCLP